MRKCDQLMGKTFAICATAAAFLAFGGYAAHAQWPQWGGPNRNFMVHAEGLADRWPEQGPAKLWHRELGDGYATIVAEDGTLYTMYRKGKDEFTVALDAKTGKTLWEHKNPSPTTRLMEAFGAGPSSTPLIVGQRLYSIGTNMVMHCFDKRTGKILWKHDLVAEYGASVPGRGYCASPIAYKNMVIVAVDRKHEDAKGDESEGESASKPANPGEGQSLMAFDQSSGSLIWKSQDYPVTHSSPILIEFAGAPQLVFLMNKEMIGVNPDNGDLLWHHPFKPEGANLATPLWNGGDLLFCSSAYDSGSRVIKLTHKDGKTVPEELWYTRKMRIHHGNAVRVGDYLFGSSGDRSPAFFMSLNIKTGKVAWRERGFKKATCVLGGGKLIILDEDGTLALATATPQGLTVHSKCTIAEPYAWAAPTLVGTTLFVRDRKHIMALDLGRADPPEGG